MSVRKSLWLDDRRPMPKGFDVWAKTADAAIDFLRAGDIGVCSLDHDLADEHYRNVPLLRGDILDRSQFTEKTGYDVILWMVENAVWPSTIYLHTWNPIGRADMGRLLERHAPPSVHWELRLAEIP